MISHQQPVGSNCWSDSLTYEKSLSLTITQQFHIKCICNRLLGDYHPSSIHVEVFSVVMPCSAATARTSETLVSYHNIQGVTTQKTSTLHSEDGGSTDLRNVGIVPQKLNGVTTQKTSTLQPEDGGSMDLRNVGIVQQKLNGVTIHKTSTWIFSAVKTSNLRSHKMLTF
jgi:hypothetical protein